MTSGTVTVVLSGDLDIGAKDSLEHHLARISQCRPRWLIFEMAQVSFIDCASARLIVGLGRALPEGARPVIRGSRPIVRRVLHITGLDTLCYLPD
jgi:anti-anti-sigma factor